MRENLETIVARDADECHASGAGNPGWQARSAPTLRL
jgi:hypothetical protein